ncbi:MAG: 5'-nucleotidase [Pseudomonadales bacterium]|nr:5'-nucleotidase [Pseudomonadales bacterium]
MTFPIEDKLVIAVSSSALFDLSIPDKVFREEGPAAYKAFQEEHIDEVLGKGVAFPFVKRFLSINKYFPEELPVEVVLLSRNSPTTGRRVFRSIKEYDLDISRAAFVTGKSPYAYVAAFNASLFLSANDDDVHQAIQANLPAGIVLPSAVIDDDDDDGELRLAFDFDGVIADDEAETVYKQQGLPEFQQHETIKSHIPHNPGLLAPLFKKLSGLQKLEDQREAEDIHYQRLIRTAIITARSAPAHERVITSLEAWGIMPNETFFLGGMDKKHILSVFKPHMFFDDQRQHLQASSDNIPMVHIPFGIANR